MADGNYNHFYFITIYKLTILFSRKSIYLISIGYLGFWFEVIAKELISALLIAKIWSQYRKKNQ